MKESYSIMTMSMLKLVYVPIHVARDNAAALRQYKEMMAAVSLAGYRRVDITKWEIDLFGLEAVRHTLDEFGLSVSSYINFDSYASGHDLPAKTENGIQQAEIAKVLGADVYMLVPVAHDGIEAQSKTEIHDALVAAWTPIVSYARTIGLHVVIEDTPDLRLQLCSIADVRSVLDRVPKLELVYDSGNMILAGEDPVSYLQAFSQRIGYVHLKDIRFLPDGTQTNEKMADGRPTGAAPLGTGIIDLPAVIRSLEHIGYKGNMTIEYNKFEDLSHLDSMRKSLEYVKSLRSDA